MSSGGELAFQAEFDKRARKAGWRRMAQANAPRGSTKGWPDRCYFRGGYVLVLEFKAERDTKVTVEQQAWLNEWRLVSAIARTGQIKVALVRPSDLDMITSWLAGGA